MGLRGNCFSSKRCSSKRRSRPPWRRRIESAPSRLPVPWTPSWFRTPEESQPSGGGFRISLRQLKPLKAIQFFLDAALVVLARSPRRALADPAPFLHQQFLVLAVGLQIDRGNDVLPHQDRQREIAEQALILWHIGLEAVTVIEEQFGALALDNKRIERREDVHRAIALTCRRRSIRLQHLGPRPVLLLAGAFERD